GVSLRLRPVRRAQGDRVRGSVRDVRPRRPAAVDPTPAARLPGRGPRETMNLREWILANGGHEERSSDGLLLLTSPVIPKDTVWFVDPEKVIIDGTTYTLISHDEHGFVLRNVAPAEVVPTWRHEPLWRTFLRRV